MAPKSKLTDQQVAEIVAKKAALPDITNAALAAEYGVDASRISRILSGKASDSEKSPAAVQAAAVAAPLVDVPHNLIEPSPLNPRKSFDSDRIAELSESIHVEGVLQNLVVRPHPTKSGCFEIASGERRWRAVGLLIEQGRAQPDYLMTLRVKDLTDRQLIELAMAENMARADMTPLEEAESFQKLLDMKASKAEIASIVGKSVRFVELRLKLLTGLCPEARAALHENKITVEQARALTTAPLKQQAQHVENIIEQAHGYETVDSLRETIHNSLIPVVAALFDAQDSGLEIVTDDDTGERFITDSAKFAKLQTKALDAKVEELKKSRLFVDLVGNGQSANWFYSHDYPKAGKAKTFGCVVVINRDMTVTIHDRLLRRKDVEKQEEAKARQATGGEETLSKSIIDALTRAHLEHARRRKTYVMQMAVAEQPLMAMRLLCLALLGGRNCVRLHEGQHYPEDNQTPPMPIELVIQAAKTTLNLEKQGITVGYHGCHAGKYHGTARDEMTIWAGLYKMDRSQIEQLLAHLTALRINASGAGPGDKLITVAIAASLGITDQDMGFDKHDLEGLRRPALERVTKDNGDHETKDLTVAKLREILPSLRAQDYVVPTLRFGTESQIKAAWDGLPTPDADQPDDEPDWDDEDDDDGDPTFDEDEIDDSQEAAQ